MFFFFFFSAVLNNSTKQNQCSFLFVILIFLSFIFFHRFMGIRENEKPDFIIMRYLTSFCSLNSASRLIFEGKKKKIKKEKKERLTCVTAWGR